MAPIKNGGKGNGSILKYFKIPQSKWLGNQEPEAEIQVATASSARPANNAGNRAPSKEGTSQKKRGRPCKLSTSPLSSLPHSSQSSSSSNASNPRRRGRPRKSESQQMRDHQLLISSSPSHSASSPQKSHASPTQSKSPVQDSQFNVNSIDGTANVTPTKDSPYRSPADTPSKRRVVNVVEIPSSSSTKAPPEVIEISSSFTQAQPEVIEISSSSATKPTMSMAATEQQLSAPRNQILSPSKMGTALSKTFGVPPEPQQTSTPSMPAPQPASMPSFSTSSTAPPSSVRSGVPISSTSSKRRVTKDGLQAVGDSDSEDEDSDEDLPSWQSFIKPRQPEAPPAKRVKLSPPAEDRPNGKQSNNGSIYNAFKAIPKSPPRPKYRKSLAELVAEQEQWQLSRATVESLESSVAQAKQKEENEQQSEEDGTVDQEMLMDAVGSDSDEQDRMIKALERTEALQDDEQFTFFFDSKPVGSVTDYPLEWTGEGTPYARLFKTPDARASACVSDMVALVVSQHPLPQHVTAWMVAQLCYEPDATLRKSYVEILKASLAHRDSISVGNWGSFSNIYCTRSLFPGGTREKGEPGLPPGLKDILQIVQRCAPAADDVPGAVPSWTCEAFMDLALMNVDHNIRADANLSRTIAVSIQEMLDELSEESFTALISGTVDTLFSPSDLPARVRYQAISSLPTATARATEIRRQLALHCFSTTDSRKSATSQDWPKLIQAALGSMPEFHISPATDYRLLSELVAVLEIAVSGGWTDHSQLVIKQPEGVWGELPPPTEIEQRHNSELDRICQRLETLASKIHDSGASHLRRTEAKTSIERLVVRLENIVRARSKPKKSVFGGDDNGSIFQRSYKQATFSKTSFVKQEPRAAPEPVKSASTASTKTPGVSFTSSPPVPRRLKNVTIVDETPQDDLSDSSLSSLDDSNFTPAKSKAVQARDSRQSTPKTGLCYCNGADEGRMIGCDNAKCERKWFHFACLGIDQSPSKEKWFCKECKAKKETESEA